MLSPATTPPRLITLVLLSGLSVLSLNMFLPSLSNMAEDFRVDYALVSLSVAGYLAMTAVVQLFMGPLSDRFGRRPVILTALGIFTVASLGCLLATDITVFLVFRMMQGAVIAGWAISLAVIRDTVPPQEAASRIGYVAMAMAIAPMVGPLIGGLLDEIFGWRASFAVYVVFGALVLLVVWADLGETNATRSKDFTEQFRAYPDLLRSRRFWGYTLCTASSTAAFYAFLAGAPLVTKVLFDMSAGTLGFYMGTITMGFFVGNFVTGRLAKRVKLTTMIIAGRLSACFGPSLGLICFLAGNVSELTLFGATVFVGFGNGLTLPSSNAGAVSVRPGLAGSAAGLLGALTVGCGALLTLITGAFVSEENGAFVLLALMLATSAVGLAAGIFVRAIDAAENG